MGRGILNTKSIHGIIKGETKKMEMLFHKTLDHFAALYG